VHGLSYVERNGSLNEQFPEIKTTTVEAVVDAWKGK
jgi:hypothetical protein